MSTLPTKPIAVCISDIHFNINNLELSSLALQKAIQTAEVLSLPLVIAGDLNDTKSLIRGEVANRLIEIFKAAQCPVHIIVGNHDLLNEKGSEHSLNFLAPYVTNIISGLVYIPGIAENVYCLSYQNDADNFKRMFTLIEPGSILICHQGFQGAFMGDYIVDKTSVDPKQLGNTKIISGHYHKHQDIENVTYIGSPYTMSFGEANDGGKGFLILNSDGTFKRVLLDLRKHYKFEFPLENLQDASLDYFKLADLVWLKVHGQSSELKKLKKKDIIDYMDFKLDLIPTDSKLISLEEKHKNMTDVQLLMILINNLSESEKQKDYLKELFNEIIKS